MTARASEIALSSLDTLEGEVVIFKDGGCVKELVVHRDSDKSDQRAHERHAILDGQGLWGQLVAHHNHADSRCCTVSDDGRVCWPASWE